MTGCLQHSLNVCLAWVASQLGAKNFYSYMRAFGIGHQAVLIWPVSSPGASKCLATRIGTMLIWVRTLLDRV